MEIFFLLFIFFYALLLWSMESRWRPNTTFFADGEHGTSVALLVPFRNEAAHLPSLLSNLENTLSPSQEVIFVDDSSSDDSGTLVSDFIRERKRNHWVLLRSTGLGKKAALTTGVHYTRAEVILATDADGVLPPNWVKIMTRPFQQPETQLVAGPVMTLTQVGFFARFQQIEWGSILLMTQYLFSTGRPLMCSGANLAYRRSAFLAVGGYSGNDMHLSGDDEFLLKKIVGHFGRPATAYLHEKGVLVETQPLASWSAFIQQRVRWASKWRLHRSWSHASSAVLAFCAAAVVIASLWLLFGSSGQRLTFLLFWAVKIMVERKVLGDVLADFQRSQPFYSYVATSILHPVYVIWVGMASISGKYTWKGRTNNFID
jgi:biofilm PGA synthesis N-glycosyltransferase PgaC